MNPCIMRIFAIVVSLIILSAFAGMLLTEKNNVGSSMVGSSSGEAHIGGPFTLTDHQGNPFTEKDLLGKASLIYFGFTYCPDICPTTLSIVTNALNTLGDRAKQVQPILISVDPERDTQEVLAEYVTNFHSQLIGLTGSLEQVKQAADAYKVYYAKQVQEGSATDYLVDHSGYLFLMDKDGKYVTHFSHNVAEDELAGKLEQTIQR